MATETIALIAHDRMKDILIKFVEQHKLILQKYHLVATGTTGKKINEKTGLKIVQHKSGAFGGDIQIAAQILNNNDYKFVAVIFLVDPMFVQPHEPDIQALIRICQLLDIPFATNISTAHCILESIYKSHKISKL